MPEMPVQLVILRRLANHLAGMTVADHGYDMTGRVHVGRAVLGKETALPALNIIEAPDPVDGNPADEPGLVRDVTWRLLLQGFVEDDKAAPTDPAYRLKAAVERRLAEVSSEKNGRPEFPDAFRLGRLISGLTFGIGVVRPPQENVSDKAFFWLPLNVRFKADARHPTMTVDDENNP